MISPSEVRDFILLSPQAASPASRSRRLPLFQYVVEPAHAEDLENRSLAIGSGHPHTQFRVVPIRSTQPPDARYNPLPRGLAGRRYAGPLFPSHAGKGFPCLERMPCPRIRAWPSLSSSPPASPSLSAHGRPMPARSGILPSCRPEHGETSGETMRSLPIGYAPAKSTSSNASGNNIGKHQAIRRLPASGRCFRARSLGAPSAMFSMNANGSAKNPTAATLSTAPLPSTLGWKNSTTNSERQQ